MSDETASAGAGPGRGGNGAPKEVPADSSGSCGLAGQACAVDDLLSSLYPGAACALNHNGPFQLLVATVLSAQTTDARVNTVTPTLFATWPGPAALAGADRDELERVLRPLGMQRTRAERLIGLASGLLADHGGQVPADRQALTALPGVGRKTANVVLGNAFGAPAITVDTHVGRLARRLGWTQAKDPLRVERDIAALWPPHRWTDGCHRLIEHGRTVCKARSPAARGAQCWRQGCAHRWGSDPRPRAQRASCKKGSKADTSASGASSCGKWPAPRSVTCCRRPWM